MIILKNKMKAAYEHGRWDYRAGALCNPSIPMNIFSNFAEGMKVLLINSWVKGWNDEKLVKGFLYE